ncbi:hypothetical protein [Bacteroides fragilis]|uniref:hypothetical protein n=1 Tax=Bacteroides fragilis TaxID=817 RepID=UPI00202FF383|nr:hypothetical protein [Bacteroides fragilis]
MNNMERLPADTFFLDLELRQEVERMASLGYAPDDIASYLGLDAESFVFDAGRDHRVFPYAPGSIEGRGRSGAKTARTGTFRGFGCHGTAGESAWPQEF